MKRLCSMLTSLCLLSGAAIAQQTPGPVQPKLTQMMQNASAKNLEEAKDKLIFYYHANMFGMVDKVLTQYPQLVDTKIKGKDGKEIPLVYDCFRSLATAYVKLTNDDEKAVEEAYKEHQEALRRKKQVEDVYSSKFAKRAKEERDAESKYNNLCIIQEQHRRSRGVSDMLRVLYNHGAECRQCLQLCLRYGTTVDKLCEETSRQYLPMYGASPAEIRQLSETFEETDWVLLAKEIRVTTKEEARSFFVGGHNEKVDRMRLMLARLVSKDPAVQQAIEKDRSALEEIYKQEKLEGCSLSFPKVKLVTFLGKNYQPTSTWLASWYINDVNAAYQRKVETEYLAYGEKVPASLTTQRDQAVKKLQTARTQLNKYEDAECGNRITQRRRKRTVETAIKLFKGDMEMVRLFLEHFKGGLSGDWSYVPNGAKAGKITYQIPVMIKFETDQINMSRYDPNHMYMAALTGRKVFYDARPERFGNELKTIELRRSVHVYNNKVVPEGNWEELPESGI